MVANIAHVCGTKKGIANGVDKHIGITVTQQSQVALYLYAAQPKVAASHQLVNIISKTNSYQGKVYYKRLEHYKNKNTTRIRLSLFLHENRRGRVANTNSLSLTAFSTEQVLQTIEVKS